VQGGHGLLETKQLILRWKEPNMSLEVLQFPCRSDNFGVILHDSASGKTAAIDAPETEAVVRALRDKNWSLDELLVTHWHPDHVEGNLPLKERFNCKITGPKNEAAKIPGIDATVSGGDVIGFAGHRIEVIDCPGHTLGGISYYWPQDKLLFAADTLFALGCGRLLEGTPGDMWASLSKLMTLPDDTQVYCGHEYTLSNAKFAVTVDPDNAELLARADKIKAQRELGEATLPTSMGLEKRTNPFLRPHAPAIRKLLNMQSASDTEVFAEIRRRKDVF
jgi:hydroxyacylglutathione hydrolase